MVKHTHTTPDAFSAQKSGKVHIAIDPKDAKYVETAFAAEPWITSPDDPRRLLVALRIRAGKTLHSPVRVEIPPEAGETRVVIVVEAGAVATVMHRCSPKAALWAHGVDVRLADKAELTFAHMSKASGDAHFSLTCSMEIGAEAKLCWYAATFGGNGGSHSLRSHVRGDNANSTINWVFAVRDHQRQHITVRNVFDARDGGGEITLKGIAEDTGRIACNGMIEITERGQGTNTYLTENALMLDATAHVDAVPGLEIRTNDVKASHSATVSRITPEDLFYFRSRGIDPLTARRMFVEGFLADIIMKIEDASLRAEFLAMIPRQK